MTTNATGVVSVESQAGTVTLADGLIVLVPDQSVEPALTQTLATIEGRWQQGEAAMQRAIDRLYRTRLRAWLHRFYRTASDALVFVCSFDADRDARCHVLLSDPDHAFGFSAQGNAYWVYANGMVSKKHGINALSGDWLMESLPWRVPALETELADGLTNDTRGRWLLAGARRTPIRLNRCASSLRRSCQ